MTRDEWIDKWHPWLCGMALNGLVLATDEKAKGPLSAGGKAVLLPEKVMAILQQMYATAQDTETPLPVKPQEKAATNGTPRPRPASSPPAAYPRRA